MKRFCAGVKVRDLTLVARHSNGVWVAARNVANHQVHIIVSDDMLHRWCNEDQFSLAAHREAKAQPRQLGDTIAS